MVEFGPAERMVSYLCPSCEGIVRVDLARDEVHSSSSSGHSREVAWRKKILVADDSPGVRREAVDLLTEAGLQVVVAADGEEAARLVRDEHPDLVLIGLLLPGKSGFDVLREIRSNPTLRNIPVLAISRVYKDEILGFLHRAGAQGLLDREQLGSSLVFRVLSLITPSPIAAA